MKQKIIALVMIILLLTGCASGKPEPTPTSEPLLIVTEPTVATTAPATVPATELPTETTAATTTPPPTETLPPPTTAPTEPPAIVITKHPTSETVSVGARTWFIAAAENETQIT